MAATVHKPLPLQSSTTHNSISGVAGTAAAGKKTIEEIYQKKTQLEHILLRPDTYIGSVEKHTQALWVYENEEMVHRPVTYVPGLYKIFDEILVNAADNKQRDPSMDSLKVDIDAEANCISIYNNGDGVPVEIHQEEGVYVPEMIFGHLLTSSNYDDNVKKTTGGRNGYGAKLTNIFSTEFIIQTADGKRQKKYKQVFSGNMGTKTQPSITKCKEGENWTKVTFKPDLLKFNMDHLEEDVVALMKKRVVDLAGTLGKTVKVDLNGKRVPVKTFGDYVNLYLQTASKSRSEPLPRIVEKVNDRWEICISLSDGQFQQVSFVNSINTIKGGTHVEYVTSQIASHVMSIVNKKNKNANLKPHNVKSHLWVFVNCLIDNPAFDSQTKETLTTRQGSFGSKCDLSQDFLKKVAKSGIVENLLSWADFKQHKELKKTDGAKRQKITGISKLDDANDAGGKHSDKCTLILTEGDSAKALAMGGIAVVGRDYYGVFPLRGKLLNVREASHKQIMENAEIQNIKQILGLQQGKQYDSVKGLRYGHLMIMTDQDHDGSHIKGLLINFIHTFWPSLLKIPSFLVEFITPIVKATYKKTGKVTSFYTMPEYEAWKESLRGNASSWSIKYYKGLGTSTSQEGKEYFQDLQRHKKDFVWSDEQDGDAIELAFSKKKIEARKNWLRQFEPGTHLDQNEKLISYSDFVNKELILFSMADLQRSIPSMVDGLKPGQRKILFCSFKRNFVKELKIGQFAGYVSEHSAYHHGEQSLATTIIGMAQDFVGSNNINLLQPNGQFGTRHQGGKDHASARYIYTKLSPITRFLFPKEDDLVLDYLTDDGQSIEPTWYVPIIPMVLVNGSEGIGTGWSSYIPNYNPRDIVKNVRRLLNNEPMVPMNPWYRGFKGLIEKTAVKETGAITYTVTGIMEEIDSTTVAITELPIRRWTLDYKEFLESLETGNDKVKEPFIKDFREYSDDVSVHFEVTLSEENMIIAKQEGLDKKFKLATSISTSNMHLFDHKGVIKKYDTPEQILEEFFHLRITYYEKRKKALLDTLELELLKLDNKVRFILGVVEGRIIVNKRKGAELFLELKEKGFTPFPKETKGIGAATAGVTEEAEESEETAEVVIGGVKASDYDYLISMSIASLTLEKVQKLCAEKEKHEKVVVELRSCSPSSLWNKDLDALEKKLDELEKQDAEAEVTRKKNKEKAGNGGAAAAKKAPKKPRKNNTKPSAAIESMPIDSETVQEVPKPKPKRRQQKSTAKTVSVESDEDEAVIALKDRLAAYNLDSSPETSAMETETVVEIAAAKGPKKRAGAAKKPLKLDSDEEDTDDENFENDKAPRGKKGGGGGRKPAANATKTKAITVRKKGDAQNKSLLSQKLISELLPPATNAVNSPEKKVRKIRPSPFNKKSGSLLNKSETSGSGSQDSSSGASAEDFVARARPKRENRARVVYVESVSEGSEAEDEEDEVLSEYSNFEEEDED
ncbi:DNA topoisomerase 2 [Phalaenopsis equestris]|uniref:DNA topoisomerase 2 n=1 Tax=Phalaenopsis equestris TaxID=78828 RepID=UPI0009E3D6FE|nr:DNA topoisomerase 2 [Phalaenopsis equestris]